MKTKERCTAHGGNPFLMEILAPGSCFWALSAGTNPKRRYGNNPIHRPDGFESSQNDAPLNLVMEGLAKVVSHWPRDENGARSSDGGSNILGDCDRDCGNSVLFNLPLNQSDRLMTNGSGRREQGKVGSLFLIDCAGNALGDRSLEPLKIEVLVLPVDALVSRRLQGLLSNHACEFEFPCVPGQCGKITGPRASPSESQPRLEVGKETQQTGAASPGSVTFRDGQNRTSTRFVKQGWKAET